MDFTDLNALLTWLAGAGLAVWCVSVSDWFRNTEWPWHERQSPAVQQLIIYLVMGVPPLAAYLILQFVPAEAIAAAAPHFKFAATLLSAMLIARGVFEATKHRADDVMVIESDVLEFPKAADEELKAVG